MFMGIDGGGTHLRVVVCDAGMRVVMLGEYGAANPSSIGRDAAAALIRGAIRETLDRAVVGSDEIDAVGIGIAGASVEHARDWLNDVVRGALPNVFVAPSSDFEIALVAAHGQRYGVLILAGTGSAIFGVNASGELAQVGGWGYLLGDEGSGYWLGLEALRALTHFADGYSESGGELPSRLAERLMDALKLQTPRDVIGWLYTQPTTRVTDVAQLARIVFAEAEDGDPQSRRIVEQAATDLAAMTRTAQHRLGDPDLPVAFAGGLLEPDTFLRRRLCAHLNLSEAPAARYPPVVGAALLAQQEWSQR